MENTQINLEQICMGIILYSGNARGFILESMDYMKPRNEEKITELMTLAKNELNQAHQHQTALLTAEASGKGAQTSVLLIHAQDHLMTTITMRDLVEKLTEVL
ncbi:PTS lactose/cellobiose transporter subunit IIA [Niallia circulans]|uniref:PTS lactose/cellobiose transporter subunit IIA n=1 Tax=Niallia circulans TaxID=1397 RepID=A0A553STY1_NIACI|nr:PTS lactose/cellobiose transporter subunit IIA [Niallia circulans]TRZ40452.1 PTS lactose/cellobiose transporter subunit IIA [Niallia circulans]